MTSPKVELPTGIGIMANYGAIAPGEIADENAMLAALASLTRDDALFACARVNAIATGFDATVSHVERQRRLVGQYCDPQQIAALDEFAKNHGGIEKVSVFFEGQLLELARWVAKYCVHDPNDGETFNKSEVRSAFVRAALIASDLWNARVYSDRFKPTGNPEEELQRMLGAFRKSVEQSAEAEHTGVAMARAWLIFVQYLPIRLPDLDALFTQATGMSIEAYFTCVCALFLYTFPNHPTGPIFRTRYVAEATAFSDEFDKFIALRGQRPESLAESIWDDFAKNEFRGLRTKPIVNAPSGVSMILDPVYFTESMTVGPLFDVLAVADHRKVFGAFGFAFEDYILDHLREMFPGRIKLPSRLSTNVKGKNAKGEEFECDAILNDVVEAFVLEIKASWIREDVVLTEDHAEFLQELLKKYGLTPTDRKGVAQLARSVGAIARREWSDLQGELAQVSRIYPLLVVHDQRLSAPGTAPILNLEFRRSLGEVPPRCQVENLIILTVSDIENLASSVQNFGFAEFLRDYSAQVPGRASSVRNFMSSPNYGSKIKPSDKLRGTTDKLMDAVKRQLFPHHSNEPTTGESKADH